MAVYQLSSDWSSWAFVLTSRELKALSWAEVILKQEGLLISGEVLQRKSTRWTTAPDMTSLRLKE